MPAQYEVFECVTFIENSPEGIVNQKSSGPKLALRTLRPEKTETVACSS